MVQTLSMPNGLAVVWHRSDDGLIAIGNDPAAGSLPQTSLVGSDAFAQVLAKAGAPSDANVPFYLNVADLLKLFPVQVDANLEHLGGGAGLDHARRQQRLVRRVRRGQVAA